MDSPIKQLFENYETSEGAFGLETAKIIEKDIFRSKLMERIKIENALENLYKERGQAFTPFIKVLPEERADFETGYLRDIVDEETYQKLRQKKIEENEIYQTNIDQWPSAFFEKYGDEI